MAQLTTVNEKNRIFLENDTQYIPILIFLENVTQLYVFPFLAQLIRCAVTNHLLGCCYCCCQCLCCRQVNVLTQCLDIQGPKQLIHDFNVWG